MNPKILFMGTPEIAATALSALLDAKCNVVGVFTGQDKPRGRGHQLAPTAVKALALERGVPVYTPTTLRDDAVLTLLSELSPDHEAKIKASKRIANPGCHASGAIAILYPLVAHGILDAAYPFAIHSLTGYSGGGKKMIADYEAEGRDEKFSSPCQYALTASHKHLPEIKSVCSLDFAPAFNPIVSDFYSGMCVCVPVQMRLAKKHISVAEMHAIFAKHYENSPLISVAPLCEKGTPDGLIFSNSLSGKDSMQIIVSGNEYTMNIYALFCNLGKGASGAAIENMNIAIGACPVKGLVL